MLKIFEWVSIPLAYTQVVTIATYGYFFITLFSRQITGRTDKPEPDIYVPIFTILQFLFYMGWFKVGEDLFDPLGDGMKNFFLSFLLTYFHFSTVKFINHVSDDDDFELNYVLDRNFQISFMLAEQVHGQLPPLEKDLYWGQSDPKVPHTKASIKHRDKIFGGHLANFKLDEDEQEVVEAVDVLEHELEERNKALKTFGDLIKRVRGMTHQQV